MKRMTAWLAAVCLIATCILPVRATETSGTDLFETAQERTDADSRKTEEQNPSEADADEQKPEEKENPSEADADGQKAEEQKPEEKENPSEADADGQKPEGEENPSEADADGQKPEEEENPSDAEADSITDTDASPDVSDPLVQQPITQNDDWNAKQASVSMMGGIEVTLMNALPIQQGSRIYLTVTLEGVDSKEVVLESNSEKHSVLFEDLQTGTYHLMISEKEDSCTGFGFLTYEQDIQVQGDVKTAEIYTGFIEVDGIN